MNTSLFFPINPIELGINLGTLLFFSRKVEIIYGSRYILIPYLICMGVTLLSFLPCNMDNRINKTYSGFNPNSLNFSISQILFIKYRLELMSSPLLTFSFIGAFLFVILPESYTFISEQRNILLSTFLTCIAI